MFPFFYFFKNFFLFLLVFGVLCSASSQEKEGIVFQGNHKYSVEELKKIISDPWSLYLKSKSLSYIDDAAYLILLHYRTHGYSFAQVDYDVKEENVIFQIQEYQVVIVKKISILRGDNSHNSLSFPQEKLQSFLTKPGLLEEYYLDKGQIIQDMAAIESFYINEGYLNVHCEARYQFFPEPPHSKEVQVEVLIEEKERSYLDSIEFSGNQKFSKEELYKVAGFEKSLVLSPSLPQQMASRLKDFYRSQGYARIEVSIELRETSQQENRCGFQAIFSIQEGDVYWIRSILVSGNELTLDEVIRRQITFQEKDRYDASRILESRQAIQDTGLFLVVEAEESYVDERNVDLSFSVKERNNKTLTFRLGYETSYGVLGGVEFEHINIFGTGRRFLASAGSTLFSSELSKSEFKMQLVQPQLFGSKTWSSRIELSVLMEDTPTFSVFDKGGGIFFEKKLSPFLTMELGYGLLFSEILEVNEEDKDTQEGLTIFSYFSQKITLNLRDEEGYPTSGSYHFIEFQESSDFWGADVNYIRFYAHTAWYFNLIERWVLSFSLRGGVIIPFGNSDSIPIQKRFFSGGASTLRSFKEKEMPPLDEENDPRGGEGIFLASTELRIPIYGNLGISTFLDAGQIMPLVRKPGDYRISHLKYAVGGSLWYNTPIGPIRFDMGFNPQREENPLTGQKEAMFAWFISIGFSY